MQLKSAIISKIEKKKYILHTPFYYFINSLCRNMILCVKFSFSLFAQTLYPEYSKIISSSFHLLINDDNKKRKIYQENCWQIDLLLAEMQGINRKMEQLTLKVDKLTLEQAETRKRVDKLALEQNAKRAI